ncbi:isoprenyl transferase [Nakamurella endophytica]|uniref:Isoprenyl transferase n=1 Tax=Nakamurella endophytica TaxID=1748367 RepID=A0A917SM21_9ACTN|nr:isoprenyl transferase [Nakamurella endophytica]GGL87068.1 isoprenyl transferase [Nakamurella endophytica]
MRLPALLYRVYEERLRRGLTGAPLPRHVGVIIDGNRRWARKIGLADPSDGHRAGAAHIANLLDWCRETGIGMVTLWLLSTDNLHRRDEAELQSLLSIITDVVDDLAAPTTGWKLRIVGSMSVLPPWMVTRLTAAEMRTEGRTGVEVNIAVGYGGRQEIADAVISLLRQQAQAGHTLEEATASLTVDAIAEHLYTSGQPDPDLVIRTSGEQRLSGFLLWQSAHSEYWFYEADWPDFRRVDFLRALRDYAARHRRFGE